jgi:hypothetical protein
VAVSALRPTQPPVEWILGVLSPGANRPVCKLVFIVYLSLFNDADSNSNYITWNNGTLVNIKLERMTN